jgi:hypothetical protein
MNWGWIIGGFVVLAVFGMLGAARRNNDPIYQHLLFLLFSAAEVTDDIYDDCIEMQQLMAEVRKMRGLDGGLKTGRRLAHLATMIPYYGNYSPLVQSRARSIVDRMVENRTQPSAKNEDVFSNASFLNEGKDVVEGVAFELERAPLLDDSTLQDEMNNQLNNINEEYRKIIERHIKYDLQHFERGVNFDPAVQLVIMRRAAARKGQKKAPMLNVETFRVGKDTLTLLDNSVSSASVTGVIEVRDATAFSLVKKQPFDKLPDVVVRAMLTASLCRLNGISIENDISSRKTPICYCLYDKATDKFIFFATRSVSGQTKNVFAEMRDFSHLL